MTTDTARTLLIPGALALSACALPASGEGGYVILDEGARHAGFSLETERRASDGALPMLVEPGERVLLVRGKDRRVLDVAGDLLVVRGAEADIAHTRSDLDRLRIRTGWRTSADLERALGVDVVHENDDRYVLEVPDALARLAELDPFEGVSVYDPSDAPHGDLELRITIQPAQRGQRIPVRLALVNHSFEVARSVPLPERETRGWSEPEVWLTLEEETPSGWVERESIDAFRSCETCCMTPFRNPADLAAAELMPGGVHVFEDELHAPTIDFEPKGPLRMIAHYAYPGDASPVRPPWHQGPIPPEWFTRHELRDAPPLDLVSLPVMVEIAEPAIDLRLRVVGTLPASGGKQMAKAVEAVLVNRSSRPFALKGGLSLWFDDRPEPVFLEALPTDDAYRGPAEVAPGSMARIPTDRFDDASLSPRRVLVRAHYRSDWGELWSPWTEADVVP